jgi:predicted RNA-binding Zn-ribbon protein involved in translation (DUF1610 family)
MQYMEVRGDLAKESRRLWIGFVCPNCNGFGMKWRSGGQHPKEAIIEEVKIMEGNSHPILHGEYEIGSAEKMLDLRFEDTEWSCKNCGFVLAKDDGSSVRTEEEVVRWLIRNRYCREESEQKMLTEDYEGFLNSLFAATGHGQLGQNGEELTLSCPQCGHQQFVQGQEAMIFTPIRIVEGRLTWQYGEQIVGDWGSRQETYYFCLNCGFEAPEPFDEWVEDGCLADWRDED